MTGPPMERLSNPTGASPGATAAYVRTLLELLGDRDPLEVMEELPSALRAAVEDMEAEELREPEAPGRWSVMDVVRHLADSELVYRYRMRMIVAQPGSALPAYGEECDGTARRGFVIPIVQMIGSWIIKIDGFLGKPKP